MTRQRAQASAGARLSGSFVQFRGGGGRLGFVRAECGAADGLGSFVQIPLSVSVASASHAGVGRWLANLWVPTKKRFLGSFG
jgi:hypothetical protein